MFVILFEIVFLQVSYLTICYFLEVQSQKPRENVSEEIHEVEGDFKKSSKQSKEIVDRHDQKRDDNTSKPLHIICSTTYHALPLATT